MTIYKSQNVEPLATVRPRDQNATRRFGDASIGYTHGKAPKQVWLKRRWRDYISDLT